ADRRARGEHVAHRRQRDRVRRAVDAGDASPDADAPRGRSESGAGATSDTGVAPAALAMLIHRQSRRQYLYEHVATRLVGFLVRRHGPDMPKLWVLPSDFIAHEVIATGLYDKAMLLAIKSLMGGAARVSGAALDVGANIGNHTMLLARVFEEVVAFEPNP